MSSPSHPNQPNISDNYPKSQDDSNQTSQKCEHQHPRTVQEHFFIQESTKSVPHDTINRHSSEKSEIDVDYDADVDDDMASSVQLESAKAMNKNDKILREKYHIYQFFQPWAIKTYGDHSKTKTITIRKKVRILKTLEGKEHSRPDSSKFRFWVKTKGFTTRRPENFSDTPCAQRRLKPLPPNAILSDNPADVDLYVASTSKDLNKRHYRKVAVVEEFFDIIYNVHMELGGRSGLHAGQKRTYRIISETYAFLPREAVTRFLTICPECKKNLRATSPTTSSSGLPDKPDQEIMAPNESSSDVEVFNNSSHTESSLETGPTMKISTKPTDLLNKKRRYSNPDDSLTTTDDIPCKKRLPNYGRNSSPLLTSTTSIATTITPTITNTSATNTVQIPRIYINPNLHRSFTPPFTEYCSALAHNSPYNLNFQNTKSRDNLLSYYSFVGRLAYGGNLAMTAPQLYGKNDTPKVSESSDTNVIKNVLTKSLTKHSYDKSMTSSSDDDADNLTIINPKRFKFSMEDKIVDQKNQETTLKIPHIGKHFYNRMTRQAIPRTIQTTPITNAINLSKTNLSIFRYEPTITAAPTTQTQTTSTPNISKSTEFNTTKKLSPSVLLTSTPTLAKAEIRSPTISKILSSTLRIPQIRSTTVLPSISFDKLKPITSTYLQLTRSMGLSDEEALRFDHLVSDDFQYDL